MPTQKQPRSGAGHFHAVRFYNSSESLCRIVADFIAEGLAAGQPALVLATAEHRDGIVEQLLAKCFDLNKLQANGDVLVLDAHEFLSQFMVDGMPDDARFRRAVVPLIERACGGQREQTIRAYGEMVDVLWKAGQTVAAVRLETMWNHLAQTHEFALLCGYSMGSFYKDAAQQDAICRQHSHVIAESGEAAVVN